MERAASTGEEPVRRVLCKGALSVNPCFNLFKKTFYGKFQTYTKVN